MHDRYEVVVNYLDANLFVQLLANSLCIQCFMDINNISSYRYSNLVILSSVHVVYVAQAICLAHAIDDQQLTYTLFIHVVLFHLDLYLHPYGAYIQLLPLLYYGYVALLVTILRCGTTIEPLVPCRKVERDSAS